MNDYEKLSKCNFQNTTYYEVAKQWVSCNSIMREVDLLLQQKRAQKLPDKAVRIFLIYV